MMAPYLLRLLCLCLAAFFVVHTAVGLAVAALTPLALRAGSRMPARRAAGFLLALRLLPAALALALVAGLCVPSYLLLEQEASVEKVGWLCLALAALAGCLWAASIARSLRAAARSARHSRDWEKVGSLSEIDGARKPVCLVDSPAPLLALAGVLHTRLVMSRQVARVLTREQLQAALRHEEAHRMAHDNLKRLLLLFSPASCRDGTVSTDWSAAGSGLRNGRRTMRRWRGMPASHFPWQRLWCASRAWAERLRPRP